MFDERPYVEVTNAVRPTRYDSGSFLEKILNAMAATATVQMTCDNRTILVGFGGVLNLKIHQNKYSLLKNIIVSITETIILAYLL